VARLGELERAVMNVLWASPQSLTAKAIGAEVGGDHAVTTVLTVLSRLERKGVVQRERSGRAHSYRAVASREDHVAELMREALGTAADTDAALARFVSAASPAETAALRRALNRLTGDPV
jgi:predicted transcriptional regulator